MRRSVWVIVLMLAGAVACGGGGSSSTPVACSRASAPSGMTISGFVPADGSSDGVFDPSLTEDACGRVWMSYSAVRNAASGLRLVSTRIARANSQGSGWEDVGVMVNNASEYTANPVGPLMGTWQHEVSRIVYDAYASGPSQRWKLLWHRYRWEQTSVGSPGAPLFQHGWIALSTSAQAGGPWSPEHKLFVGTLYDAAANDGIIGPPEYYLPSLDAALGACLAFTEPGMLALPAGVYISLKCATGAGGAGNVVLLRCDHEFNPGTCTYRGTLLTGTEAASYNNVFGPGANSFTGFSASELFSVRSTAYLLVTPTELDAYRGCLVFELNDVDNAVLLRDAGSVAVVRRSLRGSAGSFNGACGYTAANTALGVLYSETVPPASPVFRISGSGQTF